jgi:hypothetical protein
MFILTKIKADARFGAGKGVYQRARGQRRGR